MRGSSKKLFSSSTIPSSSAVEEEDQPRSIHSTNNETCALPSSREGLSMQSAAGFASAKVGKRKSRAIRKPPIKVFSADSSNFMAMVHRLTGFESSAYLLAGSPQASVLKPFATGAVHTFTQGVYVPDPPAGDKLTKSFSNNTLSCMLPQRMPPLGGRRQLDSIDDANLSTKEGLFSTFNSPSGTDRLPPYMHSQVYRNNNSWDSCGAVLFPNQGGPEKKDCRKEENGLNFFKEQRMVQEDVGAMRQ